jgi:hypothetical protein
VMTLFVSTRRTFCYTKSSAVDFELLETNMMNDIPVVPIPIKETLYELQERLKRKIPHSNESVCNVYQSTDNPTNAAWAFCHPNSQHHRNSGTGINCIDVALTMSTSSQSSSSNTTETTPAAITATTSINTSIVMDISGDVATGKTSTILTLASQFLVRTRVKKLSKDDDVASKVVIQQNDIVLPQAPPPSPTNVSEQMEVAIQQQQHQPQVILFDTNRNSTSCVRRVCDMLYTMIFDEYSEAKEDILPTMDGSVDRFHNAIQMEVSECLQRLQIARVNEFQDYIAILETLRYEMVHKQYLHPTLVLWDDFLDEPILTTTTTTASNGSASVYNAACMTNPTAVSSTMDTYRSSASEIVAIRMDVIRQLERLVSECQNTILVTTSSTRVYSQQYQQSYNINRNSMYHRIIGKEWNRFVTHTVHLEQKNHSKHTTANRHNTNKNVPPSSESNDNEHIATVTYHRRNNSNNHHPLLQPSIPVVPLYISDIGIVS